MYDEYLIYKIQRNYYNEMNNMLRISLLIYRNISKIC